MQSFLGQKKQHSEETNDLVLNDKVFPNDQTDFSDHYSENFILDEDQYFPSEKQSQFEQNELTNNFDKISPIENKDVNPVEEEQESDQDNVDTQGNTPNQLENKIIHTKDRNDNRLKKLGTLFVKDTERIINASQNGKKIFHLKKEKRSITSQLRDMKGKTMEEYFKKFLKGGESDYEKLKIYFKNPENLMELKLEEYWEEVFYKGNNIIGLEEEELIKGNIDDHLQIIKEKDKRRAKKDNQNNNKKIDEMQYLINLKQDAKYFLIN